MSLPSSRSGFKSRSTHNMISKFKKVKDQRSKIALERIEILESMIERKPEFATRYRALIKRLREKYRLHKGF
jgi:hypothetical protein